MMYSSVEIDSLAAATSADSIAAEFGAAPCNATPLSMLAISVGHPSILFSELDNNVTISKRLNYSYCTAVLQ